MEYWRLVSDNIIEWQEVLNKTLTKKALRENYIVTLAITINAFGKLGRFFYDNSEYKMSDYLSKLKQIDWLRSNDIWVGRTIRENGKVLNSEEAIAALQVLGYTKKDIEEVLKHIDIKSLSLEGIIKSALKLLSR